MSLSNERDTIARRGDFLVVGVKAGAIIYAGALACVAMGFAVPGSANPALRGAGRAEETVDNSAGQDGDLKIRIEKGVFLFGNLDADPVTAADIGHNAYVVDDETVAKTDGNGARGIAGLIVDVDDRGVWIDTRANVGGKVYVRLSALSTKAADAAVSRIVSPVAGKITKVWSVSNAALAAGDATLTAKINATLVTGGVVTITQAGSVAGDVDSAAPTAANVVVPGDLISVTGGGASTATATAEVLVEITV
jgi:hypothetical protein